MPLALGDGLVFAAAPPTTTVSAESVESVEIVETFCSCELR